MLKHGVRFLPHVVCLALVSAWLSLVLPGPLAVTIGVLVVILVALAWWLVSARVLAWLLQARPLTAVDATTGALLAGTVAEYARQLGIDQPSLLVVQTPEANALAAGHARNGAVILTTGLLAHLSDRQLKAILGHEMAHLKYGDNLMLAVVLVSGAFVRLTAWTLALGAIAFVTGMILASALLGVIIADAGELARDASRVLRRPLDWAVSVSSLTTGAVLAVASRDAEYRADRVGACLAGRDAMVGALVRLAMVNTEPDRNWLANVYATHPSTAQRIQALRPNSDTEGVR